MICDTIVYYETGENQLLVAHDTLEDAIEYAEQNDITVISEIGGSWTEYEKCWFCGEWFDTNELNTNSECSRCESAIKDHFGYEHHDRMLQL